MISSRSQLPKGQKSQKAQQRPGQDYVQERPTVSKDSEPETQENIKNGIRGCERNSKDHFVFKSHRWPFQQQIVVLPSPQLLGPETPNQDN